MMGRNGRMRQFKHRKAIICLIDALIVLMAIGFIFKLCLTNTETNQIRLTPTQSLSCQICGATQSHLERDYCCDSSNDGDCINAKTKEQCRKEVLAIRQQQTQLYQGSLITLIILGSLFFLIDCCCDKCLNFLASKLIGKNMNEDYPQLLKSGAISTLDLAQNSSGTSFSSLKDITEGNSDMEKSFWYRMEQMACPECLETLEQQRVVYLGCRHIMHSSCAIIRCSKCPICSQS